MAKKDKVEIWVIEDEDECTDHDGNAVPYLVYVHKGDKYDKRVVVRKDGRLATLEQLVGLCDHDAESVNAHDFCGTHRLLGAILYQQLGRGKATAIMLAIAERRGLHGMSGVCTLDDSYAELGVGEYGRGWNGSYGK